MSYNVGPVKPWVLVAANDIGPRFGIKTVYGFAAHDIVGGTSIISDHALGLALDFMCALPVGDKLAAFTQANAAHFGVTYIIHNSRIWNISRASEGWRVYHGTNPHTDHVHVSFQTRAPGTKGPIPATPSNGGGTTTEPVLSIPIVPGLPGIHVPGTSGGGISIPNPISGVQDVAGALGSIASVMEFLVNPKNWIRMLMFGAGLILILIALGAAEKASAAASAVGPTISKATQALAESA